VWSIACVCMCVCACEFVPVCASASASVCMCVFVCMCVCVTVCMFQFAWWINKSVWWCYRGVFNSFYCRVVIHIAKYWNSFQIIRIITQSTRKFSLWLHALNTWQRWLCNLQELQIVDRGGSAWSAEPLVSQASFLSISHFTPFTRTLVEKRHFKTAAREARIQLDSSANKCVDRHSYIDTHRER